MDKAIAKYDEQYLKTRKQNIQESLSFEESMQEEKWTQTRSCNRCEPDMRYWFRAWRFIFQSYESLRLKYTELIYEKTRLQTQLHLASFEIERLQNRIADLENENASLSDKVIDKLFSKTNTF